MTSFLRTTAALLLATGWLSTVARAATEAPPVQDNAGLFSTEAVQKAREEINDLKQRYDNRGLFVETFATPPEGFLTRWAGLLFKGKKVQDMDPPAREQYFADLARRHARPNSVYVLVCKEPLDVQVVVGRGSAVRGAFTPEDCGELHRRLVDRFNEGQYDQGLLEAVDFAGAHLGKAGPASSASWAGMLEVIGVLLGVWLVIEVVRGLRFGGRRGEEAGRAPNLYGGGGSLLTGLFAALAGSGRWDTVFPMTPEAAGVPPPPGAGEPIPPGGPDGGPPPEAAALGEAGGLGVSEPDRQDNESPQGIHGEP